MFQHESACKEGSDGREISRTLKEDSNHLRPYQAASKVDTDQCKRLLTVEMSKVHIWPHFYQESTVKVAQRPVDRTVLTSVDFFLLLLFLASLNIWIQVMY